MQQDQALQVEQGCQLSQIRPPQTTTGAKIKAGESCQGSEAGQRWVLPCKAAFAGEALELLQSAPVTPVLQGLCREHVNAGEVQLGEVGVLHQEAEGSVWSCRPCICSMQPRVIGEPWQRELM